jgi:hypothetical protein
VQAKQPRKPFKSVEDKNLAPLDLIHSDLCEMNGILTRAAKKYFITFIDDATRYCQLYLVKTKDKALNCIKIYKAEVENQLEKKIKRVRSDRGGEYLSNEFGEYCAEHGIIHETTTPYLPQSNGVAQRKNRTLTYLVNAMLDSSCLPKSWWGEAILAACFVLNRVPSVKGDKTPYEGWKGRKPALGFLRAWGCLAEVNVPACKKRKLGQKPVDCAFLGYAHNSAAYRFLVIKSDFPDVHVNTVTESRDASFFEDIFPMKDRVAARSEASTSYTPEPNPVSLPPTYSEQHNWDNNMVAPHRSKRQRTEKPFSDDFIIYLVDDTPKILEEAYASPDADAGRRQSTMKWSPSNKWDLGNM